MTTRSDSSAYRRPRAAVFTLAAVLLLLGALVALPRSQADAGKNATTFRHGAVVSVSPPASDVGAAVLQQGGNAVDAAVATALALAVTYPAAGNVGGGGFMVVHPPKGQGSPTVFEYRETAPAAATAEMFAKNADYLSAKAVGVPGTVRGLELAHRRFGKLPWKELVEPAVKLAAEGFVLDGVLANQLNGLVAGSGRFPELRRVFGKAGGQDDWSGGDKFVQPDLAKTLRLIADQGADAFYQGPVADLLVATMQSDGGLVTKADLAAYKAKERAPIHGTYRGYDVYGPPPPSSGGIGLIEMLNVLENFDLRSYGRWAPESSHLMIEAMRRAYRDRAQYLGDADFISIPDRLTTKEYARQLAAGIDLRRATPSASLAGEIKLADESPETTHFSVIDRDGLAVANTYTLEHSFGSRVVVRGGGFLLNNEMSDFNPKPGVTTRRGQIGTPANQVAPGKRMLSSQTPTIVAKDGKPYLITGSPGSRTIINTVLCVVVNVIDFDMDVRAAVDASRLHHQWFPDEARLEHLRDHADLAEKLRAMGHKVAGGRQGDAHSIVVDPKTGAYHAAEDRRIIGKASGY